MITFPLELPAIPGGPRTAKLRMMNTSAEAASPFTGEAQVQEWPGEWWEYDFGYAAMTPEVAAPWEAFFGMLRGIGGTFLANDPFYAGPRGSALGGTAMFTISGFGQIEVIGPLVYGVNSAQSRVLNTYLWQPNQEAALKAGDYIGLMGASGIRRLHMVLTDAPTDSTGHATLDIWPSLREELVGSTGVAYPISPIVLGTPLGTFRLMDNAREVSGDQTRTKIVAFKAKEAL